MHVDTVSRWLTFAHLPALSRRERFGLLEHFGNIDALFDAGRGQLAKLLPDRHEALTAIAAGPDETALAPALDWLARGQQHLVTWMDTDYPRLLRQIPDPPLAFYLLGQRAALSPPQLAVVGSRNPTPAGRENARAFARHLAGAGLGIASGLALGVDGAAHRGALDAGGVTIAVTATGLDRVYPPRHRELAHEIVARGALISEFPLGMPPLPENFPMRNRLISGLALGTLVVEAAVGSGSLITARLATDQGREVFAIPGSIHSPLSRGCHALIRQGAKLVETANDILEELGALAEAAQGRAGDGAKDARAATENGALSANLSPPLAGLLAHLGYDPASVDQLVERSGLTPEAVSSMLLELELQGLVEAGAGGKYQRIF